MCCTSVGRGGVIAAAAVGLAAWLAQPADANWHAVAGKLPRHYRLLESEPATEFGGEDVVCYGGRPRSNVDEELDCDSNSLSV